MPEQSKRTVCANLNIDLDAWNQARWRGVSFTLDPSGTVPPVMGLIFENGDAGGRIFADWQARFGKQDVHEELRISIIEGDVPRLQPGYFVLIGCEEDVALERALAAGTDPHKPLIALTSRVLRIRSIPGSPHLANFKQAIAQHGQYDLVPVLMESGKPIFISSLGIRKTRLHFRTVTDIGPDDIDAACLHNLNV